MALDLIDVLNKCGIDAVDHGQGIRKDNIGMQCPFCGAADMGRHMSVCVRGERKGVWGCWRDRKHSGSLKNIGVLFKMFGMPPSAVAEAKEAIGAPNEDREKETGPRRKLDLGWSLTIKDYLEARDRGEELAYADNWADQVDAAMDYLSGRWRFLTASGIWLALNKYEPMLVRKLPGRVVFPVRAHEVWSRRHLSAPIENYVARAVLPSFKLRYMTAPSGEGTPIKELLYNGPTEIKERLVVCEGVFDAISVEMLHSAGTHAVATFGTAVSEAQARMLWKMARSMETYVLFDEGAEAQAMQLAHEIGGKFLPCPDGDPEAKTFECLSPRQLYANI